MVTAVSEPVLRVEQTIQIKAPIQVAYEAVLEQLGPAAETHEGQAMPMKFEPWPGGRWFRDLGNDTGHFWGHVQVIKPPSLIEINGPLFMSYPALSHVQYRLTEQDGGTLLRLLHRAIGDIATEHREGVADGWNHQLGKISERATQSA